MTHPDTSAPVPRPRVNGSKALGVLTSHRWLLRETVLDSLCSILTDRAAGVRVDPEQVEQIVSARRESRAEIRAAGAEERTYGIVDGVAVVPITGLIVKYSHLVNGQSQPRGTSTDSLRKALRQAVRDDAVEMIALDIDSPGGIDKDVAETADLIARTDKKKPVVAICEGGLVASAAQWLASAARARYGTRGSEWGSIGVFSVMVDESARAQAQGVEVHVLRYGQHKNAGMIPGEIVTPEAIAIQQAEIDASGEMFVAAIASGHGITQAAARELADGRVHFAEAARSLGLVDEIVRDFEHALQRARAQHLTSGERSASRAASSNSSPHRQGKDMTTEQTPAFTNADEFSALFPQIGADLISRGATQERARAAAINDASVAEQHELADRLIREGVDADEALRRLHADLRERMTARTAEIGRTRKATDSAPEPSSATADVDTDSEIEEFEDAPAEAVTGAGAGFERQVLADWQRNASGCRNRWSSFVLYAHHREQQRADAARKGA